MLKTGATLALLAALTATVFYLGNLRRQNDNKPVLHVAGEVPLTTHIARPERGTIVKLVQAPGDVEPVLEVEIRSEIVAKIEEMPVEEGHTVARGDLLCRLKDDTFRAAYESGQARVESVRAAIVQAEADVEKAQRDLDRQIRLSEQDSTSDLEMRDYLTIKKKALAALEIRRQELVEAEAFVRRALDDLERTVIRSPIDGVISRLSAKEGEIVVTGTMNNPGTVIMKISDLSRMQVRARVDEVDVPLVKPGQKAKVYLQSDQAVPVPAEVVRVAASGTKPTGRDVVTFETLLEVQASEVRVKPGMTANVEIEVAVRHDTVTLPVEAVVHRMRKELPQDVVQTYDQRQTGVDLSERARQAQYIKVVFVRENDTARVRLVDIGIADTRRVEILSGITMDDTIVTGPYRTLDQLADGRRVKLSDESKQQLAAAASTDPSAAPAQSDDQTRGPGDNRAEDEGHGREPAVTRAGNP